MTISFKSDLKAARHTDIVSSQSGPAQCHLPVMVHSTMSALQNLPIEILDNITHYVGYRDLPSLFQLNRWWYTQRYSICHNRAYELMKEGWTVEINLEFLDDEDDPMESLIQGKLTFITVLERLDPITLGLEFTFQEALDKIYTIAPLHNHTKKSIDISFNDRYLIEFAAMLIKRNLHTNVFERRVQLESTQLTLFASDLDDENTGSNPLEIIVNVCSEPHITFKCGLLHNSIDSMAGLTHMRRDVYNIGEPRDRVEVIDPLIFRLERFECPFYWWASMVE